MGAAWEAIAAHFGWRLAYNYRQRDRPDLGRMAIDLGTAPRGVRDAASI
jgi:hypothetical protein